MPCVDIWSRASTHLVKSPVLILYVVNTEIAESVLRSQHPSAYTPHAQLPPAHTPADARLVAPEQRALRGGDYEVDRSLDAEAGVHAPLCALRVSAEGRVRRPRGTYGELAVLAERVDRGAVRALVWSGRQAGMSLDVQFCREDWEEAGRDSVSMVAGTNAPQNLLKPSTGSGRLSIA